MLRHASAAVTLDVYADLFDDDLGSVATAFNQAAMQSDVANLLPKAAERRFSARRQERENPRVTGGSLVVTPAGFEPAPPP